MEVPPSPGGGWPPPTLCSFSHSLLAECRRCLVSALFVQPARVVDPYRLFDGLSRLLLRLEVRVEEILVLEDPVRFYGSQLSRTRFVRIKWCAWWDSNPHALQQRNLNPSCIPISPQAHAEITSEAFPCARRRPWSSARRPALPGTCHRKPASEIPQGPPSACGPG